MEFEDLVRRMRDAQKRYFRTRSRYALAESKELEREVDKRLADLDDGQDLFDKGGAAE